MVTDFQRQFIDRTAKNGDGNVIGYHIRKVPECEPYAGKFLTVEAFNQAERQMAIFQAGKEALEREESRIKTEISEPVDIEDNQIPGRYNQVSKKLGRKGKK